MSLEKKVVRLLLTGEGSRGKEKPNHPGSNPCNLWEFAP